jgi:hypothetical protein
MNCSVIIISDPVLCFTVLQQLFYRAVRRLKIKYDVWKHVWKMCGTMCGKCVEYVWNVWNVWNVWDVWKMCGMCGFQQNTSVFYLLSFAITNIRISLQLRTNYLTKMITYPRKCKCCFPPREYNNRFSYNYHINTRFKNDMSSGTRSGESNAGGGGKKTKAVKPQVLQLFFNT